MADVQFHHEAQAEYEAALVWYQAHSAQTATRFEAETERVLTSIALSPEMFPIYEDANRFATLRRFPYSVVFQVKPDQVYVVAPAHSRRSPGYWQGRA